jgi:hypothetical protein
MKNLTEKTATRRGATMDDALDQKSQISFGRRIQVRRHADINPRRKFLQLQTGYRAMHADTATVSG